MYKYIEFLSHCEQAEDDQIAWIKTSVTNTNDKELAAYRAGFKKGTVDAYQLLNLHADVKLK